MINVWIYCRIASPSSAAMRMQVAELRRYAEKRGYAVAGVTQEYGNGLSIDRFGLRNVASAIIQGKATVVLAKDASRIARNSGDLAQFVRLLHEHGVLLECVQDGNAIGTILFFHEYLTKTKSGCSASFQNTRNGRGDWIFRSIRCLLALRAARADASVVARPLKTPTQRRFLHAASNPFDQKQIREGIHTGHPLVFGRGDWI